MTEPVSFKVFAINGVAGEISTQEFRERLAKAVVEAAARNRWWIDATELRCTLLKCERLTARYVHGVFAQQHLLERHLYDDQKRETRDEADSYEDRFFVLDLEEGLLVLEWRQFRAKPPLKLPLAVARLQTIIADLIREEDGPPESTLEDFKRETTKEEFLTLFYTNRVVEISVTSFGRERVPPNIVLVNPNPHLEGSLRDIIEHDVERDSLDELSASVNITDANSDLRRAAIVRAAVHSSEPRFIRYQRESGQIRVRRKFENGIISVEAPVFDTDTPEQRMQMAATIIAEVSGIDLGPLPQLPERAVPDNFDLFEDQ